MQPECKCVGRRIKSPRSKAIHAVIFALEIHVRWRLVLTVGQPKFILAFDLLLFIQVNPKKNFPSIFLTENNVHSSHVTLAQRRNYTRPLKAVEAASNSNSKTTPHEKCINIISIFFFFLNTFCRYFTLGGTVKEMLIN